MTALTISCRCGARWSGTSTAHCSMCHITASGVSTFDAHRKGGMCVEPGSVGLELVERAGYQVWGTRMDDVAAARLAALRAAA